MSPNTGPHLGVVTDGTLRRLAIVPHLIGALTVFLLLAIVAWPSSSDRSHSISWNTPRSLADHVAAASSNYGWAMSGQSTWQKQAIASLNKYKGSLLGRLTPYWARTSFWTPDVYEPIITCPPDRPLTRYGGRGDGSKLLCSLEGRLQQDGCVIYSLGSNGDYAFELSMLKETTCEIHTFDCTYSAGQSQHPGRHFFHLWCLGEPQHGQQYRTWTNITGSLGHKKVDLLKMDIEGYEYEVLSTWRPEDNLPEELSMEFHAAPHLHNRGVWPSSVGELGLSFMHLANLGYAAYSKEVNPLAPDCCAEFSFLRLHTDATSSMKPS